VQKGCAEQSAEAQADSQASQMFTVEKLLELAKGKRHPRLRNAHRYTVKTLWTGYEGTADESSWEPFENIIEDIPHMAYEFLLSNQKIERH